MIWSNAEFSADTSAEASTHCFPKSTKARPALAARSTNFSKPAAIRLAIAIFMVENPPSVPFALSPRLFTDFLAFFADSSRSSCVRSSLSAAFSAVSSFCSFCFNSVLSFSMLFAQSFASLEFFPCVRYKSLYLVFSLSSSDFCSSISPVRESSALEVSFTSPLLPLNAFPNACPIFSNAFDIFDSVFSASSSVSRSFFLASLVSTMIFPLS